MGRIPKYRRPPRAERYGQATGTTPVSLTIPRGPGHAELTILDSIIVATVNGTDNADGLLSVNGVVVARRRLATAGNSYWHKLDIDGAWPLWRVQNTDGAPFGFPRETYAGPPPDTGTTYPIYGGVAGSGELNQRAGQSFTPTVDHTIDSIGFRLQKVGNPTDTFRITIRDTSITGTILSTIEVSSADILSNGNFYLFYLPTPITLLASTEYFVQLLRLGSRNTSNYIEALATTNSGYADGGAFTLNNNVWSSESTTDDLAWATYVPNEVIWTPPTNSTDSCLTVTYHYEKPSEIKN